VVSRITDGLDPPEIDGEPGYLLIDHVGPAPRPLVDRNPDDEPLPGGVLEGSDDEDEPDLPDDDAEEATNSPGGDPPAFDDLGSHDLYTVFEYSVGKAVGLTVGQRRSRLQRAVKELGFDEVSRHLRALIRMNSTKRRLGPAITKWRRDLKWLRSQHRPDKRHATPLIRPVGDF
jgi:hypothetical protein